MKTSHCALPCLPPMCRDNHHIYLWQKGKLALNIINACKFYFPESFFDIPAGSPYEQKQAPAYSKVLNVLKIARFRTSMVAFKDYFQISKCTIQIAFQKVCIAIATNKQLRDAYLFKMDRTHANRVCGMHEAAHSPVKGLAFSINSMHIK